MPMLRCNLALVLTMLSYGVAAAAEPTIRWSDEWVIFGPLEKDHPVVDASQLASIPATLSIAPNPKLEYPAVTLEAKRVKLATGYPINLAPYTGGESKKTCYAFIEFTAESAGEVTFCFGADWWLQFWMNGEEFYNNYVKDSQGRDGNWASPISLFNHQATAKVRAGRNVLAMRFSRGIATAHMGIGDLSQLEAEKRRLERVKQSMGLNYLPDKLADRLAFPIEEQAYATASRSIDLTLPDADLSSGALVGLQPMPRRQQYLHNDPKNPQARDKIEPQFGEPVHILLGKSRYPWEDRHLDAIVWTSAPKDVELAGQLDVVLKDEAGGELARHMIDQLSPSGWFFSLGFPQALAGKGGSLDVIWSHQGREVARGSAAFRVDAPRQVPRTGRIAIDVINEPVATLAGAPMTVGVPMPQGAVDDADHLRLLDEQGREVPMQASVRARWSRFGSVKWLLCDFTADLTGGPRKFTLEYGPDVRRAAGESVAVTQAAGFPMVDAGRLRVDARGLSLAGAKEPALSLAALSGAFVEHENGKRFTVPADATHVIEEQGPQKLVIRRTGWYRDAASDEKFCNYVTRFVFHRDSPVLRIMHTWIFTGDGNKDHIRSMGWDFRTPQPPRHDGFLASFESDEWLKAPYLVQHDYQHYLLAGQTEPREGRAPGVLALQTGTSQVYFASKDFWQTYPNELEATTSGFTFHNWPRHNPPASFSRPVTLKTVHQHRFAHEGEVLNFKVPDEYLSGDIYAWVSRERYWAENDPQSLNAQGIARTEEFCLYLTDADTPRSEAARVLQGFQDESLRAVVDPAWVASSGVFGAIHQKDTAKYPDDERTYEQVVLAGSRWNERIGLYGKWLHGDVAAWALDLHNKTTGLHRMLRKNHHGWPIGWLPYARSGDPRLLKVAQTATRHMIDANFCHYADEAVDATMAEGYPRDQGWWIRSALPWSSGPGGRSYTSDCDYIWHAYYVTGDARARDVALLFGEVTKIDHDTTAGPRSSCSLMPSYLDMYQATWDPWFLSAAHIMAQLHRHLFPQEQVIDKLTHRSVGHFWRPADIIYYQYTGDESYRLIALNHAIGYSSPNTYPFGGLWPSHSLPLITQAVFAWDMTKDPFYLARAANYLDYANRCVYDGELEYGRGSIADSSMPRQTFTGYYIKQFPLALGAFERAGTRPEPIPNPFHMDSLEGAANSADLFHFRLPTVTVRKKANQAVTLKLVAHTGGRQEPYYCQVTPTTGAPPAEESWLADPNQPVTVPIAADAPAGDYRVEVGGRVPLTGSPEERARTGRRHGRLFVPLTDPDVPEVMIFPRKETGTMVHGGGPELQYWFQVPKGVTQFWVRFTAHTRDFNRVCVFDSEHRRVWDKSFANEAPGQVMITVPPDQAGKIWGVSGSAFTLDPAIPPYFSVSRVKWFNPEASSESGQ